MNEISSVSIEQALMPYIPADKAQSKFFRNINAQITHMGFDPILLSCLIFCN